VSAPVVSVVLSFRNEEAVIPELVARLQTAFAGAGLDYELIFVNDASTDRSLVLLEEQRKTDPRIKVLNMSRRFGVAPCVIAGMRYARGDAVIYMDADLQDPPELIPDLVARWRAGADVVYTVRTERRGESRLKMAVTRAAYRAIRLASSLDLPVEAGDFKLLSRRVVDELLALEESELYLRGLVSWLGFEQVAVPYERQPRAGGATHFPLLRSWNPTASFLAAVTSFSHAPLFAFLGLGLAAGALAGLALLGMGVAALAGAAPSAAAALVAFGVLLWSTLVTGIGVVGLYLARVHREALGRPRYIVESAIGFDER
jgi:glycosyltransferase involved in cell wall biosynthesis